VRDRAGPAQKVLLSRLGITLPRRLCRLEKLAEAAQSANQM
jgi:hypothetical protein